MVGNLKRTFSGACDCGNNNEICTQMKAFWNTSFSFSLTLQVLKFTLPLCNTKHLSAGYVSRRLNKRQTLQFGKKIVFKLAGLINYNYEQTSGIKPDYYTVTFITR